MMTSTHLAGADPDVNRTTIESHSKRRLSLNKRLDETDCNTSTPDEKGTYMAARSVDSFVFQKGRAFVLMRRKRLDRTRTCLLPRLRKISSSRHNLINEKFNGLLMLTLCCR